MSAASGEKGRLLKVDLVSKKLYQQSVTPKIAACLKKQQLKRSDKKDDNPYPLTNLAKQVSKLKE